MNMNAFTAKYLIKVLDFGRSTLGLSNVGLHFGFKICNKLLSILDVRCEIIEDFFEIVEDSGVRCCF